MTEKEYILFYFTEKMYDKYKGYLTNEKFYVNKNKIQELDYKNLKNKVLLNIDKEANIVNVNKLKEMKSLCSKFGCEELGFISGEGKENGICMTFPSSMENIECDFFSFLLPYNYWVSDYWVRFVSGFLSDIRLNQKEIVDFSHELIVLNEKNFESILDIYQRKYGEIKPIIEYENFFKKNLLDDFDFLYDSNIYITSQSIVYIEKQMGVMYQS